MQPRMEASAWDIGTVERIVLGQRLNQDGQMTPAVTPPVLSEASDGSCFHPTIAYISLGMLPVSDDECSERYSNLVN
jgi:hypothetical protein